MKRLAVLASVMLLLAGCASQSEPVKKLAGSLSPRAGKAYAVVSLGDGNAQPSSTYLNARYSADKAPDGMAWELGYTLQTALANDRIGSGDSAVPGRVFLLELEPGQYRFSEANRNWPDPAGREPFSQANRLPMQHSFELQPGDAVYLGEIRIQAGNPPQLSIVDAHERDYRHINNEWKINDLSPLKIRLLQGETK